MNKIYRNSFFSEIFKSKVIVITGANGFLGDKLVELFLSYKAKLILIDKDKKLKLKIESSNPVSYHKCDFTNLNEVRKITNLIKSDVNKVDILINNASYTGTNKKWLKSINNQSIDDWNNAFRVTIDAVFLLSKSLSKQLQNANGKIINIGSIFSERVPNFKNYKKTKMNSPAAYSASKNMLLHLTRWFAANLAPKVNVNMISPGGIERGQPKIFKNKYISKTPLNRMCKEEDLFGAIIFLSSDLSKYITGQNISIDGGYSLY